MVEHHCPCYKFDLIKIDDDDYVYFCTECEVERFGCNAGCKHWDHPRVPIGLDIGKHLEETGILIYILLPSSALVKVSSLNYLFQNVT